jgi:hypothetical protein
MKVFTDDGKFYETNEELVISHIIEGYEDEHTSHEITFTDIYGQYQHLFISEIVKITS